MDKVYGLVPRSRVLVLIAGSDTRTVIVPEEETQTRHRRTPRNGR